MIMTTTVISRRLLSRWQAGGMSARWLSASRGKRLSVSSFSPTTHWLHQKLIISGSANDENVVKVIIFLLQCPVRIANHGVGHPWYSPTWLRHHDGCRCPGAKWAPGHQQQPCWLDHGYQVKCHMAHIPWHKYHVKLRQCLKAGGRRPIGLFVIGGFALSLRWGPMIVSANLVSFQAVCEGELLPKGELCGRVYVQCGLGCGAFARGSPREGPWRIL